MKKHLSNLETCVTCPTNEVPMYGLRFDNWYRMPSILKLDCYNFFGKLLVKLLIWQEWTPVFQSKSNCVCKKLGNSLISSVIKKVYLYNFSNNEAIRKYDVSDLLSYYINDLTVELFYCQSLPYQFKNLNLQFTSQTEVQISINDNNWWVTLNSAFFTKIYWNKDNEYDIYHLVNGFRIILSTVLLKPRIVYFSFMVFGNGLHVLLISHITTDNLKFYL